MLGHTFHLHVGAQLSSLLASLEPKYHLSPFLLCLNLSTGLSSVALKHT